MSYYLYYCRTCNTLEVNTSENARLTCPDCGQSYYPLHVTEEVWDRLSSDDKRRVLASATMPQQAVKRSATQGNTVKYATPPANTKSYSHSENDGKITGMSVAAFILSIFGCLCIIGLIFGIIDLVQKDGRKKGLSIAAVSIAAFWLLASIAYMGIYSTSKKELEKVVDRAEQATEFIVDNAEENVRDKGNTKKDNDSKKKASSQDTQSADNAQISISEQVLVDRDGVKITAVEYVTDSIWGDGIKMLLENNTSQNLMYSCDALIVNDFMITDLFAQSVASGKSAYETLYLSSSQLRQAGIENVGKIEIYFRIYDNDTWQDLFKTECITLQTSEYSNMDSTVNNQGIELYNKNNIKIMAQYVDEDSFWGKAILLYVENNGNQNITVAVDDLSINGFMFTSMYVDTIYAGKKSFNDITLFSSELEENGVSEVKDVELKFRIYDSDTYNDIDNTEPISFSTK